VILKQRRFSIYTHIVSGVVESISCWLAFCTGNEFIAQVAAVSAILGHVPSAYYQTSIAFGVKALTVSSYFFVISVHLFSALHLFVDPSSTYWLLNMFLIHNIYVWCRVFFFFFRFIGLFKDTLYTNSILISALILFPAVLGASANMLFIGYVVTSILLYLIIVRPDETDRILFVNERNRDLLVNKALHDHWLKEKLRLIQMSKENALTDQQQAKQVFDLLDVDKNGFIDGDEINDLLKQWESAGNFMKRFSRWSKEGHVTYENFYKHIWRLGNIALTHDKEIQKKTGIARARFIFDCLDNDSNGYIDISELQKLLIQWGLPDNEVDDYLANDDDKRFSFEEFYQDLKPIWDFAYEHLLVKDEGELMKPFHLHSS
jgi:Ca2+-binding EF-hand superfamily protein